jgi:hypothetical protein
MPNTVVVDSLDKVRADVLSARTGRLEQRAAQVTLHVY